MGARAFSMANTSVTLTDCWSSFHNVAGISGVEVPTSGFAYLSRYGIAGLNSLAITAVVPTRPVHLSVDAYRFGDDLWSEHMLSVGAANKIGFVRLGMRLSYLQMRAEGYGSRSRLMLHFGGIVELWPTFTMGAYVHNLSQSRVSNEPYEALPVVMKVGFSYKPVPELMLNAEVEKDAVYEARLKAGMEYMIKDRFALRAGIYTQPVAHFFGVGFQAQRVSVDYGLSSDYRLGYTHQASVNYVLKREE